MTFFDEIRQQPEVLLELNAYMKEKEAEEDRLLRELLARTEPAQIIFTGMGSSLFASEIPCSYLRRKGIRAFAMEANELLRFDAPVIGRRTLLVAVSQSGNSMETVRFCEKYRDYPMIVVTNQEQGNLARYGALKLFIKAGDERFTSTKSYTNTVAMLVRLAFLLAGDRDLLPDFYQGVEACAGEIRRMIDDPDLAPRLTEFFRDCSVLTFVGSGASFASAEHGSIVLLETTKTQSISYTTGQFIHGPVEVIAPDFGCVLFDFDRSVREEADRVTGLLEKYEGRMLVLTDRTDIAETANRRVLVLPCGNPFLSPLLEIIPIELWAKYYGEEKGRTPGVLHRVHK